MRRNKDEALQIYIAHTENRYDLPEKDEALRIYIARTGNRYDLPEAVAKALFYDEINDKLPIGLSVRKAKSAHRFTVIFQPSDEQHSEKTEFEIPAACLNNIHFRKLELNLTQESSHKAWRNNLIKNTQPDYSNYFSSFFSSPQQRELSKYSDSAEDNGLLGLG